MPINPQNPFKGRQYPGEVIVLCVRRYLRYPLSYEHVTELVAERGIEVDPSCIWRWVQAYAPELNKRCRRHLKPTNKSYRIDETYINVKGEDKYLYRALDSTGQTIDFLLTAKRDTAAAKRFLRRAIEASGNPMPRVINVDKNPTYPAAMEALKADGAIPRRVVLRQCKYLNNVIEQDHRTVKKRVWLAKGYGSFQSAWRTLQGNRDSGHDPKGPREMAGEGGCCRPSSVHRRVVRTLCVTGLHPSPFYFYCQTVLLSELRNETVPCTSPLLHQPGTMPVSRHRPGDRT
jgi:IS6 family transposase